MFENLAKYDIILVAGPQRSGTKIVARMIAHDAGHTYVDEMEVGYAPMRNPTVLPKFIEVARQGGQKIVVQCPGWTEKLYTLSAKDTMLIVVERDVEDIVRSRKRMGWRVARGHRAELYNVYKRWREEWSKACENAMTVFYETLYCHPLWVPPGERAHYKRNDDWQPDLPPRILFVADGTLDVALECLHEHLKKDGFASYIIKVDAKLEGFREHVLEVRPHYAVFIVNPKQRQQSQRALEIAKSMGSKIVIGATSNDVEWAKELRIIDIVVPDCHLKFDDTIIRLAKKEHPRDFQEILWREPRTREMRWL